MDIRAYFKKTDSPKSNQPNTNSKTRKRAFIESDSEDERHAVSRGTRKKKIIEKVTSKRKARGISDSSDSENEERKTNSPKATKLKDVHSKKRNRKSDIISSSSEEISPTAKRKQTQKQLDVCVKSKFFKETSASAVFGDQPIKRDNSKLHEIQKKLKKTTKPSKNDIQLTDDHEFEATLLQLDEVGMNWINSSEAKQLSPQKDELLKASPKTPESDKSLTKEKNISPPKEEKNGSPKNNLRKNKEPLKRGMKPESCIKNENVSEIKKQKEEIEETKTVKTCVKDKLKQFRASPKSEKRVSFEVMQTEKLLSTRSGISPSNSLSSSSGYSSLSSSCDSPATNGSSDSPSRSKFMSAKSELSSSSGCFSLSPNCDSSTVHSGSDSPSVEHNENPTKFSKETFTKVETNIPGNPKPVTTELKNCIKIEKSNDTKDMRVPQLTEISGECSPWVEKYKPDSTKKIIGQQGDKSNVKKLIHWLNEWYKNNAGNKKAKFVPNGWNKDQTGACFKAALLSGPPGVGKTTTVTLVCKELGFDAVEFNASDTRSKKLLQEEVAKLLTNTSIASLFSGDGTTFSLTKKHVLVMDEVDGMAGNEDRGGIQELIQLIKMTKVPIICMCNDRNHPKIRSLVNYCFDLKFQRPRVEQIKGYMRTVCFKEKLNVSNDILTNIITSSNNDVRLVLNHLSMLAADKSSDLEASKKYVKLNPWDVLRKVFSKEDHKVMSIHDKCDLFFYDYSIAPLFVQENYLSVKPLNVPPEDKIKKMHLFAQAANCISLGDRVDREIRSNNAWSLLPTQAIFSSYAPGELLEGYCTAQINFPAWLGKNSKKNKVDRLLQEIQIHTRLRISGSKEAINLEYAPYLRNLILEPLLRDGSDGAKSALEKLHEYDLLKEDMESLNEICNWPNSVDLMSKIDSKVKAAFTRLYNKNPSVRPYSLTATIKKNVVSDIIEEETSDMEYNEEDDEADAMIIVKKKSLAPCESPAPSTSKTKSKTSESTKKGKKKR